MLGLITIGKNNYISARLVCWLKVLKINKINFGLSDVKCFVQIFIFI